MKLREKSGTALAVLLLVFLWVFAGCANSQRAPKVAGLEAVPAGFAVEVLATSSLGPQVASLIVPEEGLYRIEMTCGEGGLPPSPAAMLITVRTPTTQLGYRMQAILEGEPRPLELAYLESPLTRPGRYHLDDVTWEGFACKGTLTEDTPGADPGAYEARVDPETGLVVWERQEWDSYRGTFEITRRLVPLSEAKLPQPEDVLNYARADWSRELQKAANGADPIYGLDLPGLAPHTLQTGEVAWARYSTKTQPGRIAAEVLHYANDRAAEWPQHRLTWEETWSDGHEMKGMGRGLVVNGHLVWVRVYHWALAELGLSIADVDQAIVPLGSAESTGSGLAFDPPHLTFDGLMPLPQHADFGQLLPEDLRQDQR